MRNLGLTRISQYERKKDYTVSIERRDRKSEARSELFQWRVWCLVRAACFSCQAFAPAIQFAGRSKEQAHCLALESLPLDRRYW